MPFISNPNGKQVTSRSWESSLQWSILLPTAVQTWVWEGWGIASGSPGPSLAQGTCSIPLLCWALLSCLSTGSYFSPCPLSVEVLQNSVLIPSSRLVTYECLTKSLNPKLRRTTSYWHLSWMCGLTGLSWAVPFGDLSWSFVVNTVTCSSDPPSGMKDILHQSLRMWLTVSSNARLLQRMTLRVTSPKVSCPCQGGLYPMTD